MKVHSSLQSSYTSAFQSQSSSDSDDDTPFALPDDTSDQQQQQSSTPSVASSGVPSSLSSFWINQADDPTAATANGGQSSQSIEDQFKDLADMTPAEQIRAAYLKEQNLTEEQFSQLPSDQQKAINDAIAQQIKQKLGDDSKTDASSTDASDSAASALALV
jgi:DNA-binding helix-hairpin-helix protein with protein kinase domain